MCRVHSLNQGRNDAEALSGKKEKKKKDTEGELMENTAPAFKINIHTLGGGLNI